MYKLILRPKAEKHFARLPKNLQHRIFSKLQRLEENPFQKGLDIKKLVGAKSSYRLRVGELRVIYQLNITLKEIFVVDIDFRRTTTY